MKHSNVLSPFCSCSQFVKCGPDTQGQGEERLVQAQKLHSLLLMEICLQNSARSLKLKQADKGCGKSICVGETSNCWIMSLTSGVLI